jgi:hypothetical protein
MRRKSQAEAARERVAPVPIDRVACKSSLTRISDVTEERRDTRRYRPTKWRAHEPRASALEARVVVHYRDGAAYCVSSLRMILPPFITNLTR